MREPQRVQRVALGVLAATAAMLGVWAAFFPRAFFDDFPGFGRHWVSADGPFNEHLVRDFGNYNLAVACVLAAAAIWLTPVLVRTAAVASLVVNVPHFVYHLAHLDLLDTGDQVGEMVSLGLALVLPVVVLVVSRSTTSVDTPG